MLEVRDARNPDELPLARALFEFVGQPLDKVRTGERIGRVRHAGFLGQDLLRAQRQRRRRLGRQP